MGRALEKITGGLSRAQFLKLGAAASAAAVTPALPLSAADASLVTRPIPKSKDGERLPIMGLGTAQDFGARRDIEDKTQVLKSLFDGGGSIVDTAANYARGSSEELIGELLDQYNLRSKAFIATKFGERGREGKSGFVGMDSFGASAPAPELFEKFGITAEATAQKVRDLLG